MLNMIPLTSRHSLLEEWGQYICVCCKMKTSILLCVNAASVLNYIKTTWLSMGEERADWNSIWMGKSIRCVERDERETNHRRIVQRVQRLGHETQSADGRNIPRPEAANESEQMRQTVRSHAVSTQVYIINVITYAYCINPSHILLFCPSSCL